MDSKTASTSALHGRWAENMTFTVQVPEATVAEYEQWKEGLPTEPPQVLSRFLGDANQHWCMHSQVGMALSLLHFQARWMAQDGRFTAEFASKVARFETALAMLNPLLVGIAHFGQFDHWPGNDAVLTYPSLRMIAYFSAEQENDTQVMERHLYNARLFSDTAFEEKVELLSQPFDCRLNPALPGYLAVRALPNYLTRYAGLTYSHVQNFYLQLLREMIFGNPYIIRALMPEQPDIEPAVLNVVQAIEDQFAELLTLSPARENNFGRIRIAQLEKDDLHLCEPYNENQGLFPNAGSIMADVRRHALGVRKHRDWTTFSLVCFPETPPFILEFANPFSWNEAVDNAFVYVTQKTWRADPTNYTILRRSLADARISNYEIAYQKSTVDLEEWLTDICPQYANRLYQNLALNLFPEEHRQAAKEAMAKNGFLGLGLSEASLRTLVRLSLCSPNVTAEYVAKAMEQAPLPISVAKKEWDKVETTYGLKLYRETEKGIRATI